MKNRRHIEEFITTHTGQVFLNAWAESPLGQDLVAAEVKRFWRHARKQLGAAQVKAMRKKLDAMLARHAESKPATPTKRRRPYVPRVLLAALQREYPGAEVLDATDKALLIADRRDGFKYVDREELERSRRGYALGVIAIPIFE